MPDPEQKSRPDYRGDHGRNFAPLFGRKNGLFFCSNLLTLRASLDRRWLFLLLNLWHEFIHVAKTGARIFSSIWVIFQGLAREFSCSCFLLEWGVFQTCFSQEVSRGVPTWKGAGAPIDLRRDSSRGKQALWVLARSFDSLPSPSFICQENQLATFFSHPIIISTPGGEAFLLSKLRLVAAGSAWPQSKPTLQRPNSEPRGLRQPYAARGAVLPLNCP